MKKLFLLLLIFSFSMNLLAQKTFEISLSTQVIDIQNPAFYIEKVVDNRAQKEHIGIVKKGFFNTRRPANLANGFQNSLKAFYQSVIPRGSYQRPITIKIKQLQIEETIELTTEYAVVSFEADYYYKNKLLFSDQQQGKLSGIDVTGMHAKNIRLALQESLKDFAESDWLQKVNNESKMAELNKPNDDSSQNRSDDIVVNNKADTAGTSDNQGANKIVSEHTSLEEQAQDNGETRNILAFGYQIGGYALVGVNYEIRVHDYFGVHFGGGLAGLTGGVKIHTNPSRDSFFFNLSVKDGGFGAIETAGVEFGGRWVFKDGARFGLHYQIGVAGIISITDEMEEAMYGDKSAPDASLVMGIGFSW